MTFTFAATLVAPYVFQYAKSLITTARTTQKLKKSLHVGLELGGTNYNVAIAKPIFNSKFELMDY
jgi:hypothetical protein